METLIRNTSYYITKLLVVGDNKLILTVNYLTIFLVILIDAIVPDEVLVSFALIPIFFVTMLLSKKQRTLSWLMIIAILLYDLYMLKQGPIISLINASIILFSFLMRGAHGAKRSATSPA